MSINQTHKSMKKFFDNPLFARWGGLVFALFLFFMGTFHFIRYASTPTDENLFADPPGRLLVVKTFPITENGPGEKVHRGDLLLEINRTDINNIGQSSKLLNNIPADSFLTMKIFTPRTSHTESVTLPRKSVPDSFLFHLPPVALVLQVYPDGASDRAGMMTGDMIYKINGQRFENARQADQILQKAQLDRSIVYEIYRGTQTKTLYVTLALAGFRFSRLVAFLVGLIYLTAGVLLLFFRPGFKAARNLGLTGILFGFYLMISFNLRGLGSGFYAVLYTFLLSFALYGGIAFWFRSSYYFPVEVNQSPVRRKHERHLLLTALIPASILYVILLGNIVGIEVFAYFGRYLYLGNIMIFLYLIYAIFYKIRLRKLATPQYKEMHRITKYSGIATGILVAILFVVFQHLYNDASLATAGLLVVPAAYLYTIGKYSLMDLHIRVRRNIQYNIISLAWTVFLLFVGVFLLILFIRANFTFPAVRFSLNFIELIQEKPFTEEARTVDRFLFVIIGTVLIWGFWQIGKLGHRFISRKYYRSKYDYRLAANQISHLLSSNLDMYSLAQELARKLAALMHLKRIGVLFFREESECCCQEYYGFEGKEWAKFCMRDEEKIIDSVKQFHEVTSIESLSPSLRENFTAEQFQYLIPIRSKDLVLGLILVGEKLSESSFQHDDFEFLRSVASQAAISIENAFLYQELREQERIKQELKIARQIQMASLPQNIPDITGLDIYGISSPATEVGGDFFDYLNHTSDELTVIVGDVSGKGMSAALYMSKLQGIFRSLYTFGLSPRDLFVRANQVLKTDLEKSFFITGLAGKFHPKKQKVTVARAGHLPLYHFISKSHQVERIQSPGLGMGLEQKDEFEINLEEYIISYEKGDIFLFTTDGITEAFNSRSEEFDEKRLIEALIQFAHLPAADICHKILTRMNEFSGGDIPHDDATLVIIKINT